MDWALPEADSYFRQILQKTPGGFEIDHLDAALEYCSRRRTAIDGGAHVGTWSVHMAQNGFRKVIAFEPSPDTYACLCKNTVAWNNILPVRAALGAKEGMCIVVDDPTRQGNTGSRNILLNSMSGSMSVPVDTVDRYKFEDLDFLKLDVEGFEPEALKGAVQTIERCRPVIMVECKKFSPPRNGGPEATIQVLTNLGYAEVGGVRNDRVFTPA